MPEIVELERMISDCKSRIELAARAASDGHAWVVLSESIGTFKLIELAALALIGRRVIEIAAAERGGSVNRDQIEAVLKRAATRSTTPPAAG